MDLVLKHKIFNLNFYEPILQQCRQWRCQHQNLGGAKGGRTIFQGGRNAHEACKNLPFCAEIVKFGLILTPLKLFGGARKYFGGGKCPL